MNFKTKSSMGTLEGIVMGNAKPQATSRATGRRWMRKAIVPLCALATSAAWAIPPSVSVVTGPLLDPANAYNNYYSGLGTAHTNGVLYSSTAAPEIKALARALGGGGGNGASPSRLPVDDFAAQAFDYVRTNIDTEFRFGLGKGARGAVIDQSGTPFDQAELMVKILREGGVTANYKLGTITLDATQFGKWSGLVYNLNEAAQTFSVNARAACTLLADGGIPATVNGQTACGNITTTTNLTTVTLMHVWVEVGGKLYDPSYKVHTLKAGIDLPAAMGCGTAASPTCGSLARTSLTTGASTGNYGSGGSAVPYIQTLNEGQLNTRLGGYATSLATSIKSNLQPYASLESVIGGVIVNPNFSPVVATTLPYPTPNSFVTWTGEVPDAFRTTLRVQLLNLDQALYADEAYGKDLYVSTFGPIDTWTRSTKLYADNVQIGSTATFAADVNTQDIVTLTVNHPYAGDAGGTATLNGTFGDDSQALYAGEDHRNSSREYVYSGGGFNSSILDAWTNVITVVWSVGNTGPSYQSLIAGKPKRFVVTGATGYPVRESHRGNGAQYLVQSQAANAIVAGASKTALNQHHTMGLVYAMYRLDSTSASLNIVSMLSASSKTADSASRAAAFETMTLLNAALEGSVVQQGEDGWENYTGPALLKRANDAGQRFLRVNNANWSTANTQLTNGLYDATRRSNIQWYANNGFQVIVPRNSGPGSVSISGGTILMGPSAEMAVGTDKMSFTVGEKLKGSSSVAGEEPLTAALDSVKQGEYSLRGKNAFALDSVEGSVSLKPPADLVLGTGDFPKSLSFTRSYSSSSRSSVGCSTWFGPNYATSLMCNFGGNGAFQSRLPGGWRHNLEISAEWVNNGLEGLGATSGLRASTAIADIYTAYDVVRNVSLANRLSSSLTASMSAYHLNNSFIKNSFAVHLSGSTQVFARLPDGTFDAPINAQSAQIASNFTRSAPFMLGSAAVRFDYVNTTLTYKGAKGEEIKFIPGVGTVVNAGNSYLVYGPRFTVQEWKAPDGATATFAYTDITFPQTSIFRRKLQTVTNNLGRTLTVNYDPESGFGGLGYIRSVTDGTRTVTFNPGYQSWDSACAVTDWFSAESWSMPECPDTLSVTGADGGVSTYSWVADADSPDPAVTQNGPVGVIRKWSTPSSSQPYMTFKYDEMWHVKQAAAPLGRLTTLYTANLGREDERFGEVVDATGASSRTYADRNGSRTIEIDPIGRTTTHEYNDARKRVKSTYPEGNFDTFTYDVRGNPLSKVQNAKPGSGLSPITESQTYMEPATRRTCENLKICNQVATETDANNNVDSFAYRTSTGQLQRITGPAVTAQTGGISGSRQSDLCYATMNSISFLVAKIDKVKSAENRVTSFAYNSADRYNLSGGTRDPSTTYVPPATAGGDCTTATKSGALNYTTTITYDAIGNVSTVDGSRPGAADTTTYQFDRLRRLTSILEPLGGRTRHCYDADGLSVGSYRARSAAQADPNAGTALTTGQCPTAFAAAQWQGESRAYYRTGELLSETDSNGYQTIYAYDALGRTRVVQDPDGRQTATVYDAAGQTLATWLGGSNWLTGTGTSTAPSANAPTAATTWNGTNYPASEYARYARYDYTLNGEQKLIEDANNNQTDYVYDGYDRRAFTLFPDPATGNRCTISTPVTAASTPTCSGGQTYEKSTFDPNDNRLTLRTRKGDTITWNYDAANRLSSKAVTGSPAQATVVYGYNLVDEVLSLSSPANGSIPAIPAHSVTSDYDAVGRKSYEENLINGQLRKVGYQYDEADNRSRTTWPDGYFVHYSYDAQNRMEYVRENSTTANEMAFYQYDVLSRRSDLRYAGQATNRVNYTFEADSQLDVLTQVMNGTTVTLDHGHSNSGQLNSIAASDDFYLPSTVTSTPIAVPVAYTPDKLNRYGALTFGTTGTSPGYDLNGNLLTWGPAAALQTYTYDAENRLRTANVTGGSNNSYDYDAMGRRLSKDVGGTVTFYLLDGDEEIAEYNSAGTILRRYITGPGVDERIARQEGSSTPTPTLTYYHVDHQGSVIATTNPNGTIAQQLSYDVYGNLTSQPPASSSGEPFRFTGRRFDPETGLYYFRARYYSPQLGRFLQTDPIGYADDLNAYAYAGNDPRNYSDPTGTNMVPDGTVVCDPPGSQNCTEVGDPDNLQVIEVTATRQTPGMPGMHAIGPMDLQFDSHAILSGIALGGEFTHIYMETLEGAPVRQVGVWLVDSKGRKVVKVSEHMSRKAREALAAKLAKNAELIKAAKGIGSIAKKAPLVEALFSAREARIEFQNGNMEKAGRAATLAAAATCSVFCPPPFNAIALGVTIAFTIEGAMH